MVLTSVDGSDDAIQDYCRSAGVECFRGSLANVAARFLDASAFYGTHAFVRVSGDSPLLDYRIIDQAVCMFASERCDLVTNVLVRTYPKGQSVEVVAREALQRAAPRMSGSDAEHVTSYFYDHADAFIIRDFRHDRAWGAMQMAVDTEDDAARVERCLKQLEGAPWNAGLDRAIEAFQAAAKPGD